MRKPALLSMSSFIATRKEELARQRAALNEVAEQKDEFAAAYAVANVVAKAAMLDGDASLNAEPSLWARWDDTVSRTLRVYITLKNVESLKEGRVPYVLSVAEANGFEFDRTEDWTGETYASRTYRAAQMVGGVDIRLSIEADIKSDAQACRKVQVGTEIKEVAKYAIVCD